MKISIHDYANRRVIIANVPYYLSEMDTSSDDIATAIISALGLNYDETEYMIGNFNVVLADYNSHNGVTGLATLTPNFKEHALEALDELEALA